MKSINISCFDGYSKRKKEVLCSLDCIDGLL